MTTKEQERKAMEKIREIVKGLGEYSYIGSAMEGVWEIMEENIENDFACSMGYRLEEKNKEIEAWKSRAHKSEEDLKTANGNIDSCNAKIKELNDKLQLREALLDQNEETIKEVHEQNAKLYYEKSDLVSTLNRKDDEIVHLKAKLYDLMTEGK